MVLENGRGQHKIPCVTAMVANASTVIYGGAFGTRNAGGPAAQVDSIFAIASMTKAITSVAALQMVEKKKATLDEPAEKHLPELRGRQVLAGFHPTTGEAQYRPPRRPVTLRHLLTHTSGLCYGLWDQQMAKWSISPGVKPDTPPPFMFDAGTRWQYGTGIDLTGRLVEAVTGQTLEDYFQQHILQPLAMTDTSFLLPPAKFDRLVTGYRRQSDGSLKPNERKQPDPPRSYNGGGGLFSTAPDYIRFLQAILQRDPRLLSRRSYSLLASNQTGAARAGVLQTTQPEVSSDLDVHPGASDRHSLGFVVNPKPHQGGRAAGSMAWAGLNNTYYWIDPKRQRCAVIMMQFLPFADRAAIHLLREFELAVYTGLK